MAHMEAGAAACWFVDDKRSNVKGARMAGLAGHHFRSLRPALPNAKRWASA